METVPALIPGWANLDVVQRGCLAGIRDSFNLYLISRSQRHAFNHAASRRRTVHSTRWNAVCGSPLCDKLISDTHAISSDTVIHVEISNREVVPTRWPVMLEGRGATVGTAFHGLFTGGRLRWRHCCKRHNP